MARYFAGNSLAAFFRTSSSIIESTAAAFDSAYVSNCILIPSTATDYAESAAFSATGTVWFRLDMYDATGNSAFSSTGPTLMNGTTSVFRIARVGGSGAHQAQYWNGSAWTNTGSGFTLVPSTRNVVAVKVVLGSSFEVYSAGTLVASGSGWVGGGTTVTSLRLYSVGTSLTGTYYSQIMIADYDIRDAHLMPATLNGNSATNTGGTGAYTDVNETVLDESTAEIIATVGNKMGQTKASITVPAGLGVAAFVIAARGRVSGGTVTDGKLGIRSGGTNYSGSGRGYNGGYEPRCYIVDSDPNGSIAWTQTSFNNAEPYVEAA